MSETPEKYAAKYDAGKPPTVYEAREKGRKYCETEGSDHYMLPGVEPLDLIISCGYVEGFCLGSIIKYAVRFGETGNPEDLKKIADYAHILCGVEIADEEVRCDETALPDGDSRHSGGGWKAEVTI